MSLNLQNITRTIIVCIHTNSLFKKENFHAFPSDFNLSKCFALCFVNNMGRSLYSAGEYLAVSAAVMLGDVDLREARWIELFQDCLKRVGCLVLIRIFIVFQNKLRKIFLICPSQIGKVRNQIVLSLRNLNRRKTF